MVTQLERLNFNGKIVKPFTTREGSGPARVVQQLKSICIGADVKEDFDIKGSKIYESRNKVEK